MCQFYRFVACLPSKERYELTTLEPIVKQSNSLCTLLKDNVTEENAQESNEGQTCQAFEKWVIGLPINSEIVYKLQMISNKETLEAIMNPVIPGN